MLGPNFRHSSPKGKNDRQARVFTKKALGYQGDGKKQGYIGRLHQMLVSLQ